MTHKCPVNVVLMQAYFVLFASWRFSSFLSMQSASAAAAAASPFAGAPPPRLHAPRPVVDAPKKCSQLLFGAAEEAGKACLRLLRHCSTGAHAECCSPGTDADEHLRNVSHPLCRV